MKQVGDRQASGGSQGAPALWTKSFVAINILAFLIYCNMALFFLLFEELTGKGMDSRTVGLVIVAFSISVLVLRPIFSPFLHPANARRWLAVSTVAVALALALYPLATSYWQLMTLRLLHGAAYVLMASAAMAAFTACVPEGASGRAFGVFGTVTLLPYAILPPLVMSLSSLAGGYFRLVAWTAPLMLLALPLLPLLRPAEQKGHKGAPPKPSWPEIKDNFKSPALLGLLVIFLLVTTCFAVQFFFVAPYASARGLQKAGLFFTLSTASEIGVRFFSSRFLDRFAKNHIMAGAAVIISASFAGLAVCHDQNLFLGLALLIGAGWGIALPLFNALIFDISPARLKAFNSNLGMQSFQGGLFLGPLIGGFLAKGLGYGEIFWICVGLGLLAAVWLLLLPLARAVAPGREISD